MSRRQEVAERRASALRMRRLGKSYEDIAAELGYRSTASLRKDVSRALERATYEEGRSLLSLERERSELLLARALELMQTSDDLKAVRAVEAATRVLERRARMLGIDKAAGAAHGSEAKDQAKGLLGDFAAALQATHDALPDESD